MAHYGRSMEQADSAWEKAAGAAKKALLDDLRGAQRKAVAANDLDEANRILSIEKKTQAEIDQLNDRPALPNTTALLVLLHGPQPRVFGGLISGLMISDHRRNVPDVR
jgi:hypothetical protein